MADVRSLLAAAVGAGNVLTGADTADYARDETLGLAAAEPGFVVRPGSTAEVAEVVRIAGAHGLPVTARGSGTGLSGGSVPGRGGIIVSFGRMNRILEIDTANHAAVVQPGVTLAALDEAAAARGLVYPVYPGEMSAS
ncbi:MAG TPA: FAD-binding protein, partial [Streptosporangiaceae bacterium]|nr:FAD-binding protein [Streptosporangiaceae bacterium]